MADNLNITSGSGVTIKTDDISGVHYQQIKLVDGNLESTNPTGVNANPLIVTVINTANIVSVSNTSATVSVLNTLSVISVANTSSTVSVLNTVTAVSVLNTSATISVLNTISSVRLNLGTEYIGKVTLDTGGVVAVSNTSSTVSILNTSNIITLTNGTGYIGKVTLDTGGVVAVSNTSSTISVLNTRTSVTVSGGVTLLSSGSLLVSGGVSVLNTGAYNVTLLNTGAYNVTVLNTNNNITATIDTSSPMLVTGGVTLLSSIPLAVRPGVKDYIGCTSTWVYAALSSANNTAVWTPTAGKRFNVTDIVVNVLTAAKITISQAITGSTIMILDLAANGGWSSNLQTPYKATATNTPLAVKSTAAGTNSYISVSGYESL